MQYAKKDVDPSVLAAESRRTERNTPRKNSGIELEIKLYFTKSTMGCLKSRNLHNFY